MKQLRTIIGHRNFKTLVATFGVMYAVQAGARNMADKGEVTVADRTALRHCGASSQRQTGLSAQFNRTDGSHRVLSHYVKRRLRVPGSYKHILTRYSENGRSLNVVMTYRAADHAGVFYVETLMAEVSLDGALLNCRRINRA